MKLLRSVTAAALLFASSAHAALVSIDFDSADQNFVGIGANYLDSGFRFSPNLYYRITDFQHNSNYMTLDRYWWEITNPGFLGAEAVNEAGLVLDHHAYLYVDFGGKPFSLESLTPLSGMWGMVSSKGATFFPGLSPYPYDATFESPGWKGIKWLLFYTDAGDFQGFDNFVARVPEPGSLTLIGLGFAGLAAFRRRKR